MRGIAYRQSLETRLHARLAKLATTEQMQVRRLLRDPIAPWAPAMPEGRRALVLDAAIFEVEAETRKEREVCIRHQEERHVLDDVRLTIKSTLARDVALGVELLAQPLSVEGQLSSYLYF